MDHRGPVGLNILDNKRFVIKVGVEENPKEVYEEKHAEESEQVDAQLVLHRPIAPVDFGADASFEATENVNVGALTTRRLLL